MSIQASNLPEIYSTPAPSPAPQAALWMFIVAENGNIQPVELNKANFTQDRSIIVIDEGRQRLWLWHGKMTALIPRRMALRQAESLKAHGFQARNAIVGQNLKEIIEIDGRKTETELESNKRQGELWAILNSPVQSNTGNISSTPPWALSSTPAARLAPQSAPWAPSTSPVPSSPPKSPLPWDLPGSTAAAAPKPLNAAEEQQLLEKFKDILEMSQRVKKTEVSDYLGINEKQLFEKLVKWKKLNLPFKLDGDMIVVDDMNAFTSALNQQFQDWGKNEGTKEGKI